MLDSKGFDLWADDYDKSVGLSDDDGRYPFAGYKNVLNSIYSRVLLSGGQEVLDVGFGTGTLTKQLYDYGCTIYGQDFSEKMLEIARNKMPNAFLYSGDFTFGLVEELKARKYDCIVATYSLHHLRDEQKINYMKELLNLLRPGACLLIGDIGFQNRHDLEQCRAECGAEWDDEEFYFVVDELQEDFPTLQFEPCSHCAGVFCIVLQS